MFRELRRPKQALSEAACIAVLTSVPRGVLAVHGEDGYPYAVPMNYVYLDGKLYFHCAKAGHKLEALTADPRACFCVMDEGYKEEADWALHIKSVVVFGRVKRIEDPAQTERIARTIARKYYPTPEDIDAEVRKDLTRVQVLEFNIDHMSGKLVKEA